MNVSAIWFMKAMSLNWWKDQWKQSSIKRVTNCGATYTFTDILSNMYNVVMMVALESGAGWSVNEIIACGIYDILFVFYTDRIGLICWTTAKLYSIWELKDDLLGRGVLENKDYRVVLNRNMSISATYPVDKVSTNGSRFLFSSEYRFPFVNEYLALEGLISLLTTPISAIKDSRMTTLWHRRSTDYPNESVLQLGMLLR